MAGGAGEREAAPRLTFQDRDNRVKITPQAPVAELASLLHSSYLSSLWGQKGSFQVRLGLALPSPGWGGGSACREQADTRPHPPIRLQEVRGFPPS